jgi:predicted RNA methylase
LGQIIPRIKLEDLLESLRPHPDPDPWLEQYTTPTEVAAEMLFTAAYVYDDIEDKVVADLGCGTGRLGIGALLLGAQYVIGVDIDPRAVAVALKNAEIAEVSSRCYLVSSDVATLRGVFDTVLMNPPFGTKHRHRDVMFLSEALRLARSVYSIHKSSTRQFIKGFIQRRGGKVSSLLQMELEIPWMFDFHEKVRKSVTVDLYRIARVDQRVY